MCIELIISNTKLQRILIYNFLLVLRLVKMVIKCFKIIDINLKKK